VWAGAGVAATERPGSLLAATLLLPGLAGVSGLHAEEAPTEGVLAFKYGWYRDEQPSLRRVTVSSPQVYLMAPIAGQWSLEGSRVADSVSGATPRMHTFVSSATPYMADHRDASDVKVTRYFRRAAVSASALYSKENDYVSRAKGLEVRWSSEDNNQSWVLGLGHAADRIDTTLTGGFVSDERRRTSEFMAGLTQVLTPDDAVQVQLTRSIGRGYYSDPYKDFDERPRARQATILLARWNHHFDAQDATLRSSWRYYNDSFGIRSHTLGAEWVQAAGRWTFTPALRYYMQSAAWFYFDVQANAAGQPDSLRTRLFSATLAGQPRSADHRMAAFGAVTLSLKLAYAISAETSVDLKLETYKQAGHLRFGRASPYLDPMRAHFAQLGWSRKF